MSLIFGMYLICPETVGHKDSNSDDCVYTKLRKTSVKMPVKRQADGSIALIPVSRRGTKRSWGIALAGKLWSMVLHNVAFWAQW